MLEELILKNRSCRRFYQSRQVDRETLMDLVNLGRLCASAANRQPLKYIISCNKDKNADIFSCLAWAAYLKDWDGPVDGEQPSAYVIILGDTQIANDFSIDHGIAAQSILLGAREKGLAGCMLASVNREKLSGLLNIPEYYKILLVIAIGSPREEVVIDPVGSDGSIRYWRNNAGIHHVPKRELKEIIIGSYS
jgi:nitroreductase